MERRRTLWDPLHNLAQSVNQPWLICGDFNAILYPNDRLMGNPITLAEIQDFSDCMHTLSLSKLPWNGEYYTWSNKQKGSDRISSRIDRAFGNYEWMMSWGHVETKYGLPFILDHSHMMLSLFSSTWKGKTPFRFFNVWAEHAFFMPLLIGTWKQPGAKGKMQTVWNKLKALQPQLKQLNKVEFKGISQRIEVARVELAAVQRNLVASYSDAMLVIEKILLQNLEHWSFIEEKEIKIEIMKGSSVGVLPAINKRNMLNGLTISHNQKLDLCAQVIDQIDRPKTIKDFRPIACCTILYKLISKILANRLQKIMADIICSTQAGFIPGRNLGDNVILAHKLVQAYSRKHISSRCMIKIDLQKTYDSVERIFLQQILEKVFIIQWKPLIDKIIARISSWTAKKLSYAGRVQLVQIVLFGFQAFWAQLFVIPAKVPKLIDGYCRSYIWSGANEITKKSLIAWDRVCMPKASGGLNLSNLQIWNKATIGKNFAIWPIKRTHFGLNGSTLIISRVNCLGKCLFLVRPAGWLGKSFVLEILRSSSR
ncbi:uncharacterized protein LOC132053962 [Lycium ferocissimum]|uniref:uncharacterized protein LOC132053962 n=1 Tax=Lycium ferocissimum TaxID=112874 RepID=UPI002814A48F|nr:uncharacterized protein LOC132053962 [Lycium ferocissimum]